MRQVPHYLIIGNGRVARHFAYYFSLLSISYQQWQRHDALDQLKHYSQDASHILILTSDQAIEAFANQYLANVSAKVIHFSGSLVSPIVFGAHPLMCFNDHLYTLDEYQAIPFIIDANAPAWEELLPGLKNPYIRLPLQLKAKYHALCVLAGNFSVMLWQKLFSDFQNELNIPEHFAYPFLLQHTQNLMQNASSALTGPLVRNDQITIEKNVAALQQDAYQQVYRSFVACYAQSNEEKYT